LHSNGQQNVYLSGYYIYIVPAQADMIYCPDYDPQVVYSTQLSQNGQLYLSFGAGMIIGGWLSYDMNWKTQRVYNYGWNNGGGAGGWRTRSRAHITINNIYNTNINRAVSVNRNVLHRQVNTSRIAKYTLPTRAAKTQVSSRRPAPSTARNSSPRPSVSRNIHTASSRPTQTRAAKTSVRSSASRNVPSASQRSSQNRAAKTSSRRQSPSQPKSSHQTSGNKAAGQQQGSRGANGKDKK
jgi:hypothetical protein